MKTALVISSFVAASHVGASVSAFCLRRLGVNAFLLPTTLFGRHPGWGSPGGDAVSADLILDMWQGLKAQNIKIDAVLTGYMASPDQVSAAADIIEEIKAANPDVRIIVDPVMGDHGKLYVSPAVASGIIKNLAGLADIITPNLWELEYMHGKNVQTPLDIINALQRSGRSALVSSVPMNGNIGAVLYHEDDAVIVSHAKFDNVPHGGGDALAGIFLAHILNGTPPAGALGASVSSIFEILSRAVQHSLTDLPLVQFQHILLSATPLTLERLSLD